MMRFGLKVAIMRKVRNVKQQELADYVGCNHAHLSNVETKDWTPPPEIVDKIREALSWGDEHDALLDALEKLHK
jgi:transcriptional regulator with XRE-family HTH domain